MLERLVEDQVEVVDWWLRAGVEEVHGGLIGGIEVGVVEEEFQFLCHVVGVHFVNGFHFMDVVPLNGALELGGEEQDGVVGRELRAVDRIGRGWRSISAVGGYIRVADDVGRCAAEFISLLYAR